MGKYKPLGEDFYLYVIDENGRRERVPLSEEFWPTEEEKQAVLDRKGDLLATGKTPPRHKPNGRWGLIPHALWTLHAFEYFGGTTHPLLMNEGQLRYARKHGLFPRKEWELQWNSNEECILLDVLDVCGALGLDVDAVLGEDTELIQPGFNKYRARKAKIADARLVVEALEDINYHGLCGRLTEAINWEDSRVSAA